MKGSCITPERVRRKLECAQKKKEPKFFSQTHSGGGSAMNWAHIFFKKPACSGIYREKIDCYEIL